MEQTDERIADIEQRLSLVSALPWMYDDMHHGMVYCDDVLGSRVADCTSSHAMLLRPHDFDSNARLIANAPQDLAWLIEQLREARKDSARLDTFARMLEQTAGTNLSGMVEVTFDVLMPDGGSVGVGFGLNPQSEGSCAAEALRAALDMRSGSPVERNGGSGTC